MSERRIVDDREFARLHEATGATKEIIEQILNTAAEIGVAFLLPPLRAVGHYPQWTGFAMPGSGKSAHLTADDGTKALCGVPVPYGAITDLPRGTPLCIGCAWHAKTLGNKPFDLDVFGEAIRGTTPPPAPVLPPPPPPKAVKPQAPPVPVAAAPVVVEPPPPPAPAPNLEPPRAVVTKPTPLPKRESKASPPADIAPSLFDVA